METNETTMNTSHYTPLEYSLLVTLRGLLARAEKELADADDCTEVVRARAVIARAIAAKAAGSAA